MGGILEMPMFPLGNAFLPGEELPLRIFEPRYIEMFRALESDLHAGTACFGTVMIERGHEVGGGDSRSQYGVVVNVTSIRWSEARDRALVHGTVTSALEVVQWLSDEPYPKAVVQVVEQSSNPPDGPFAIAYVQAADSVRRLRAVAFEAGLEIDPTVLVGGTGMVASDSAWNLCSLAPLDSMDRYQLLKVRDDTDRMFVLDELCEMRAETFRFGRAE